MRLKEMYLTTKKVYEDIKDIKFSFLYYRSTSAKDFTTLKISDYQILLSALNAISDFEWAKTYIETLECFTKNVIKQNDVIKVRIDLANDIKCNECLDNLRIAMKTIIEAFEDFGYEEINEGFDIKMPPTDNFNDFADNVQMVNKILSQCPCLKYDNANIKFVQSDVGSVWYVLGVVGAGALTLVAALAQLVNYCIVINSHCVTLKQQQEALKRQQIDNKLCEDIVEISTKVKDSLLDKYTEEVNTNIKEFENGEERNKTRYCLEALTDLLDQGLEIHAALESNQEIKDLFPHSSPLLLNTKDMLKLNSGSDKEQE